MMSELQAMMQGALPPQSLGLSKREKTWTAISWAPRAMPENDWPVPAPLPAAIPAT